MNGISLVLLKPLVVGGEFMYTTGDPAFAVDRQGKIALWNKAAEKLLGYPVATALGQRCWRLLSGQDTFGNQFCHQHCSLRKMAFERRPVHCCQLCVRTAFNGRQQYAIDSRLISDATGNKLLLHTCKPGVAGLSDVRVLLEHLFDQGMMGEPQPDDGLSGITTRFMERLERVLEKHHADPRFGLPELASRMYMCARQLQRRLKDLTGLNPAEFLRRYRLEKACELLRTGKQVGLVADAVGFSSPAYFTSCFKRQFGQTPSEYLQQFH